MKRRKTVFVTALVIALFALAGCQHPAEPDSDSSTIEVPASSMTESVPETAAVRNTEELPSTDWAPETETLPSEITSFSTDRPEPVSAENPTDSPGPSEPAATYPPQPSSEPPRPAEPPKPTEPSKPDPKPVEPAPSQPAHVHSYMAAVVAPTCTDKGYTEHRCACGDSYKDSYTDALGHSIREETVAATCTTGGYTSHTCTRCGASERENETPALGHDYRDTVVAPTTTSQGYTEHTCSRCGNSYRDNYTDKLKEVFDLQAVIDYGRAYAQSLGFTIDKSMNLSNSGYYPGYYGGGYSLDFLKQRAAGLVQYTADMLTSDGDTIDGYRCNIYASYESENDKYYIIVLYG